MCLQCILIRFTPSLILFLHLLPHLRMISIGFIVLFSYVYTVHWPYLPSFNLFLFPSSTGFHPWTGPVLPSCPSFFKVHIDFSSGFHLDIAHMYILYSNQINPLYHLLFLYHPASLLFNSFQCILFFCFFSFFFYYSYVHTRLGSFPPPAPTPSLITHSAPSLSPLNTQQKLFCPYF
jgi:hypothetical protein